MRTYTNLSIILIGLFLFASNSYATLPSVTLSVSDSEGSIGEIVTVEVSVDDVSNIAASAFTLTYDESALELQQNIEAPFFQTFTNQWATIDPAPTAPDEVVVEEATYSKAVVISQYTGKVMVAGANYDKGIGTGNTLFIFQFKILDTAVPESAEDSYKDYPITIEQSKIYNESAGYSTEGETIPFFVSYDENQSDPQGQYPEVDVSNGSLIQGNIRVLFESANPNDDIDQDGVSDTWEIEYYGDTGHDLEYYMNTDTDNDGTSDYQEYLNGTNPDESVREPDAYLILTNSVSYTLSGSSYTHIYGSSEENNIALESGAIASIYNFVNYNTVTIGSASTLFTVYRSGATVTLDGTDGTKLTIPATDTEQKIIFSDGASGLIIEGGTVYLGNQEINTDPAPVNAPEETVPETVEYFSKNVETPDAYLVLNNDALYNLPSGRSTHVYGNDEKNNLALENGAQARVIYFPSDNTISIESESDLFMISRTGETVALTAANGTKLIIPATTTNQTIIFEDIRVDLRIESDSVYLGGQEVFEFPTYLSFEQK